LPVPALTGAAPVSLKGLSVRLGGDGVWRQETRMSGSLLALVLLVAVGPS
jgi:hypothetical protein